MDESFKTATIAWPQRFHILGRLVVVGMAVCLSAMATRAIAGQGDKRGVHLYFAHSRIPFLVAETRVLVDPGDPMALGRRLVAELIHGPTAENRPTIPEGTRLRSFFLLDDGTAVVDFTPQFRDNHPGSCRLEQLTLFSVVNSLVLNVSEIRRVKFLIDGAEAHTLAGHLTLEFPLTADMLLTR